MFEGESKYVVSASEVCASDLVYADILLPILHAVKSRCTMVDLRYHYFRCGFN